jgi:uncharacterized protein YifE (UPF0438 family)
MLIVQIKRIWKRYTKKLKVDKRIKNRNVILAEAESVEQLWKN